MMSLLKMIQNEAEILKIASFLDSLSHTKRLAETRTLSRQNQEWLYQQAKTNEPLHLEAFVPTKTPNVEVIHYGRNTLPLPNALKLFEKRFCRPDKRENVLYGYNEGMTRPLIGPGYFVAKPCPTEWQNLGSIVIDYFEVPDEPVVEGWPRIKKNNQGLQFLVYHQTRDFMRRVSSHVTIGAAYKKDKPLGHYFILCRNES
ncbi:MAG: hypothetical protein CL916_04290 [Deltaproteobacteria bacterium]|nr:hypothetical protein [Deltaproteobacteria bacterium]